MWTRAFAGQIVATASVVIVVLILRSVLARAVRRAGVGADVRRRWLVQIRTGTVMLLLFSLVVIWAEELRTVALSLVAVAVAVTIATKELLLCLSGALLRTGGRAFYMGDRIRIAECRGDVVDVGALSTKLLEVDEATNRRTGRAITIPNSLFLDTPIVNETFAAGYVLTLLKVPVEKKMDWRLAEQALIEAARVECESFLEEAREYMDRASEQEGLDAPIVDPTVSVVMDAPEAVSLMLRYPTTVRQSNRVGQAILRRFLDWQWTVPGSLETDGVGDTSDAAG